MHDKNIEKYIKTFEKHFNGTSRQNFHQTRKNALKEFSRIGFPTTRQEEWRFTNTAELVKADFIPAVASIAKTILKENIKPFLIKGWDGAVLVFIDGYFVQKLSETAGLSDSVIIDNLDKRLNDGDGIIQRLTKVAPFQDEAFIALNTAFTLDGTVIEIPKNTVVSRPIHILHISSGNNSLSSPRNLVLVNENAQAMIVETYNSLNNDPALVNSVTEISISENARLKHYKFQDESENTFHIGTTSVHQKNNSNYVLLSLDFGGKLVRNNITTTLDGQGIITILNGLYILHNTQHVDNNTFIDHAKPHCESHELYRGILDGKSKGVFSGKILVRRDAQKTDAKQSNNALLLSEDAQIDAKPQLEIYADDVKCTHGATVGQLDESAIAYLRVRGIPKKKAIQMLTYAFAEEIIIGIENISFRQKVEDRLLKSLNK